MEIHALRTGESGLYPAKRMSEWLYTIRERFTSDQSHRFDGYRLFSAFQHILEVVTLDSTLCPDLIEELQPEDWEHNVHEDFRTEFFRDADYLMARQLLTSVAR